MKKWKTTYWNIKLIDLWYGNMQKGNLKTNIRDIYIALPTICQRETPHFKNAWGPIENFCLYTVKSKNWRLEIERIEQEMLLNLLDSANMQLLQISRWGCPQRYIPPIYTPVHAARLGNKMSGTWSGQTSLTIRKSKSRSRGVFNGFEMSSRPADHLEWSSSLLPYSISPTLTPISCAKTFILVFAGQEMLCLSIACKTFWELS